MEGQAVEPVACEVTHVGGTRIFSAYAVVGVCLDWLCYFSLSAAGTSAFFVPDKHLQVHMFTGSQVNTTHPKCSEEKSS